MSNLQILNEVNPPSSIFLPVISNDKLYNIQGNTCYDPNANEMIIYVDGVQYNIPASIVPGSTYPFDSIVIGSHKVPNNVGAKKGIIDNTVNTTNDYSGMLTTENSAMVFGGSNVMNGTTVNSILLGFSNNFNGTNSIACSNGASNINLVIASIMAIQNSNITSGNRSIYFGDQLTTLGMLNSMVGGSQNTTSDSQDSLVLGTSHTLENGVCANLIGNNNRFIGDNALTNISNNVIGSNSGLINNLAHTNNVYVGNNNTAYFLSTNNVFVGNNITVNTNINNTVMVGAGSSSASSSFYGGSPGLISPPNGYNSNSLVLYGQNLVLGTDVNQSMRFEGGLRFNSNRVFNNYNIKVSDYYVFVNNGINSTPVFLPLIATVKKGQTWYIKNTSSGLLIDVYIQTLDAGNNIYTTSPTNSFTVHRGNTAGVIFDGFYFQVFSFLL